MAIDPEYCDVRRALEQQHLILVNDLSNETSRLATLAGRNANAEFSRTQRRCDELKAEMQSHVTKFRHIDRSTAAK